MRRAILIDKVVGTTHPSLATAADVAAIEAVPVRDRLAAPSTYEALRLGMLANPAAPAIHFLPTCDPAEPGLVISHADYFARVTQAANMFHTLGVGPGDVVSFLLPLIPQALYTVFGAEAAGISNPVNPLLEPHQIAEILEAANTKVLVALGPTEGTDIWQKVEKRRGSLKNLKAIIQVGTASDETHGIYNCDTMLAKMPSDRLLGNRIINADDVAAYFHTGGTTGTPKLVRHTHLNQVFQTWVINTMLPAPAAP